MPPLRATRRIAPCRASRPKQSRRGVARPRAHEPGAEAAPGLHIHDDLVAAARLAELDPRVVEKLAHLVGASPGVELDLRGRAGPRFDVDASRRHTEDERDVAGGFERLAPHDL